MRTPLLAAALIAAALLAGCGSSEPDEPAAKQTPAAAGEDLAAIKAYLLDHTAALADSTAAAREPGRRLPRARRGRGLRLRRAARRAPRRRPRGRGATCRRPGARPTRATRRWRASSRASPSSSEFDVIIDAGADASDPENAVPFDVELPGGKVLEQPGNFFFLTETSLFGTNPDFQARGVEPDLDGDGKAGFGEAVPDADAVLAFTRDFAAQAKALDTGRARVGARARRRPAGARDDDADDERVLRPVEELALHRGREGRRAVLRRRLAAAGHRGHPRRAGHDLRQRAPGDRRGRRGAGRADGPRAEGAARLRHGPAREGAVRARASTPSRPTRSARRPRTARRRSPARSPRPPPSSGSSSSRSAARRRRPRGRRPGGARRRPARRAPRRRPGGPARRWATRCSPPSRRSCSAGRAGRRRSRAPGAPTAGRCAPASARPTRRRTAPCWRACAAARRARRLTALAAARGDVQAALLRGAAAATLAAVEAGDPAQARRWLLLREFRTATRYTRPGADATVALRELERGRLDRAKARLAVAQGPARRDPGQGARAGRGDRPARRARLRGTPRRARRARGGRLAAARPALSPPSAAPPPARRRRRPSPTLRRAALRDDDAAVEAARERVGRASSAASPPRRSPPRSCARRANQLAKFVSLIPVEYGHGVEGTRVTVPFEIQEGLAFSDRRARRASPTCAGTLERIDRAHRRRRRRAAGRARPGPARRAGAPRLGAGDRRRRGAGRGDRRAPRRRSIPTPGRSSPTRATST